MTLAEIVADGKELCAAVVDVEPDRAPAFLVDAALVGYARQHLARLLAVAEAAVEIAPQIEGFCREAETVMRPPGGQQAGMDRSWASRVPPSVIGELRWYSRAFRGFLAAFDAAAGEKGGE